MKLSPQTHRLEIVSLNIQRFLTDQVGISRIPSTHAERKITVCSHKHSFTPYPSLSPYRQMDILSDGWTLVSFVTIPKWMFLCDSYREVGIG